MGRPFMELANGVYIVETPSGPRAIETVGAQRCASCGMVAHPHACRELTEDERKAWEARR